MVGTAYLTGQLGPPVSTPDTLSVFVPSSADKATGSVVASNSVFSPPEVMDVSRDGSWGVVVETLKARPATGQTLDDLAPGNLLRSFDLSDVAAPRAINEITVPTRPQSVSFNNAGDTVVVASFQVASGLTFASIAAGRLKGSRTFPMNLPPRADLPIDGVALAKFHPTEDLVAVNLLMRNQVVFFQVRRAADGQVSAIEPFGNPVTTNKFPLSGMFTPDGRYYITSDLMWGGDVDRFYGVKGGGVLTMIRVAQLAASEPRHAITSVTPAGWQSETIAISPDGMLLALSNLRGTFFPESFLDLHTREGSVSLYRIDAGLGSLTLLQEERFEAMLPQGLAFDPSGRQLYVGVATYFGRSNEADSGSVEVWNVNPDATRPLARTSRRFPAPRGVHTIRVN
ncbi:MAG: beta-propeller fold lactonase family protein [Luteimonas sp.]